MQEKNGKKVLKIPKKPNGVGILRYQVLNCLMMAGVPLRVCDIAGTLKKKGTRHSIPTIYQALYEIPLAMENMELHSVTIYLKYYKAEAFFVTFKNQPNGFHGTVRGKGPDNSVSL